MRLERPKQQVKNGVYRALGEVTIRAPRRASQDSPLRVLMYHKVNDKAHNSISVPPALFEEHMSALGSLGYAVVSLDEVIAHYIAGAPLPRNPVLVTFDDGYADNLLHALPILERLGYPATVFVPVAFIENTMPLPHERRLLAEGITNPTLDWDGILELERRGVRIESHGISHQRLADLGLEDATREIVDSKRRLEEVLGRRVSAFAYVKGSASGFKRVHADLLRDAGYDLGFSAISGANGPDADRFQLRRYNVEPYSTRTLELVLAGACDLVSLKDTAVGTHVRRIFNLPFGTSTK